MKTVGNDELVSITPLYAEIREDMSSYFNTGALDDLLFPVWTNFALKKLKRSTSPVKQTVVNVSNHKAMLPEDFDAVRSMWACTTESYSYMLPTYQYYQKDCRITPKRGKCEACGETPEPEKECKCGKPCEDENKYLVTYKSMKELSYEFEHKYNVTEDEYRVSGCELHTRLADGLIHIEYYSNSLGEEEEIMIPDNIYIQDWVKKYIKFKLFEKLFNNSTDETFRQMQFKYQDAERLMNEAFVTVGSELKKKTRAKIKKEINNMRNRNSFYRKSLE